MRISELLRVRLRLAAILLGVWIAAPAGAEELVEADLLIVGGTESGCAAAVQAARMGVERIVLVNDIDWLGGQFSAEALGSIDEDRDIRKQPPFARSGIFKEIMDRIEAHNRAKYGHVNPGNAWTSRTTVRPFEAEQIFRELLAPYTESGQVRLISWMAPSQVELANDGRTIARVEFAATNESDRRLTVEPRLTIDASDWGDVVKLSGAEYEFGPDLKSAYGEPHAPTSRKNYPLTDLNPLTYCLVIEEDPAAKPIARPEHYDDRSFFLTTSVTKQDYAQLDWPHPAHRPFNPPWIGKSAAGVFYAGERSVYSQRRLVDQYTHELKSPHGDVILLCWTLQDYPTDVLPQHVVEALEADEAGASKKNLVEMTRRQRQIVFDDAKQHSLGMLYHLQNTVHERMDDRKHSFRRFRLSDEFGTPDHLPPKPYLRESLRMKAMYMMREQDTVARGGDRFADVMYYDGVACWQFVYDFHPTGRMFLPDEGSDGPWQSYIKPGRSWTTLSDRALLPLRCLVPIRLDGLLGAQRNLGCSSIVSSAFRLHPHTLATGQAAGAAAAVCLRNEVQPRELPVSLTLLNEVRTALCVRLDGGEPMLLWPFRDVAPEHSAFEAINLLAVRQALPLAPTDVNFRPDDPAEPAWRQGVVERSLRTKALDDPAPAAPAGEMTRGEFARRWWGKIAELPERELSRAAAEDADRDGVADVDDAAPFDRDNDNLLDVYER